MMIYGEDSQGMIPNKVTFYWIDKTNGLKVLSSATGIDPHTAGSITKTLQGKQEKDYVRKY